jgi:hypothetical protein
MREGEGRGRKRIVRCYGETKERCETEKKKKRGKGKEELRLI